MFRSQVYNIRIYNEKGLDDGEKTYARDRESWCKIISDV